MKEYQHNRKVLFVDDEGPVLSSFKSLLRKEDVEVHVLQDSTQVWQTLEENGPFAIVFSDQRMPGLDGVGVLEAVARKHPATIRVMITGFKDHHTTLRAINIAGISSYILKPWNDDELRHLIRDGIERYNLAEEKAHLTRSLTSSHESLQTLLENMVAQDEQQRKVTAQTITALMREKELMLKEIHHRVKNNMQLIVSLLNLHFSNIPNGDVRAVCDKAIARIHSMAMVHEDLYEENDFGDINFLEYLRAQVSDLVGRSGKLWVATSVEGECPAIGIDMAVPLGMVTHEIVTNALEHAFKGRDKGSIQVQLNAREGNSLEVSIRNDGVEIEANSGGVVGPSGLGLLLVESLVDQLHAKLERDSSNGTTYRILMELPHRIERRGIDVARN
jgi:two-component sensor histidine kinase/ActR/RegA family two-component response regulator